MRFAPTRVSLLLLPLAFAAPALACEPPAEAGMRRVEGKRYVLALPAAVPPLNAPFSVAFALCARDGAPVPAPRIDAWMPAHRHGMNYRPSVAATAPGRFRADGLLFHMPGRWEFRVDVGGERLAATVDLE
jgi:hypothetical protein